MDRDHRAVRIEFNSYFRHLFSHENKGMGQMISYGKCYFTDCSRDLNRNVILNIRDIDFLQDFRFQFAHRVQTGTLIPLKFSSS